MGSQRNSAEHIAKAGVSCLRSMVQQRSEAFEGQAVRIVPEQADLQLCERVQKGAAMFAGPPITGRCILHLLKQQQATQAGRR